MQGGASEPLLLAPQSLLCWLHSRSGVHFDGCHLLVAPAHGLQRGIVVTQLKLVTLEVLSLVEDDFAVIVVLQGDRAGGQQECIALPRDRDVASV